jgi:hypothetical protein
MADSSVFDWLCDGLESATDFDRLEARGTVRIALKLAGLEAKSLSTDHAKVVLKRVMPAELEARGVAGAASICSNLVRRLDSLPKSDPHIADNTPEAVFTRLA